MEIQTLVEILIHHQKHPKHLQRYHHLQLLFKLYDPRQQVIRQTAVRVARYQKIETLLIPNRQKQAYQVNTYHKITSSYSYKASKQKNRHEIYHFTFKGTSNGQSVVSAYVPISTTKASPEYLKMTSKINSVIENKTKHIPSEPEYITAEFVRQKKMANAASHSSQQGNLANNNNGKINH